ncbi:MAG TPA: hypothetical protein VHX36_08330 [Candidatus Acidoferrales bacterium]|jgi:hypothetical protein|nr:hypothetical protein [Candidatus Acidoferrales bacterium]
MKNRKLALVLAAALLGAGIVLAQAPSVTIDAHKHEYLAEAQHNIQQAFQDIDQAQTANREKLGGHAEKAKALLLQADEELKAAAEYSNAHQR